MGVKEVLDLLADFIGKVGFPVFVAIILLWRTDRYHAENTKAINDLRTAVLDVHLYAHCRRRRRAARQSGDSTAPQRHHRS